MRNLHLYRVTVAIAEKYEDGEIVQELDVFYDKTESATESDVKPYNIVRRPKLAEKLAGIPSEEILTSVVKVKLACPFL